jgi:hypothetical protein
MMGNETLAAVRARLAAAMAGAEGGRASSDGRSEVAEALERFLAGPKAGRGKPVPASKSGRGRPGEARRTRR